MRKVFKLNKKQRDFLDKIYEERKILSVENLTNEEWLKLLNMGNNEMVWMNAERYILDKKFETNIKRR